MKNLYIYPNIDTVTRNGRTEYYIDYCYQNPDGKLVTQTMVYTDADKATEKYRELCQLART